MSIKAKISVDDSELRNGLKNAESQASATGKKMKTNLEQAGKGFEAVNKAGGAVGGIMKNAVEAIKGLLNPIGLITAAIGILITIGTKLWDMFTVSAAEEKAALESVASAQEKLAEETVKAAQETEEYLETLKKINSSEEVSNTSKLQAIRIINELTSKYGDLGLSIDEATGKIKGLDKVQDELAKKMAKENSDAATDMVDSAAASLRNHEKELKNSGIFVKAANKEERKVLSENYTGGVDFRSIDNDKTLKTEAQRNQAKADAIDYELQKAKNKRAIVAQGIQNHAGNEDDRKMWEEEGQKLDDYIKKLENAKNIILRNGKTEAEFQKSNFSEDTSNTSIRNAEKSIKERKTIAAKEKYDEAVRNNDYETQKKYKQDIFNQKKNEATSTANAEIEAKKKLDELQTKMAKEKSNKDFNHQFSYDPAYAKKIGDLQKEINKAAADYEKKATAATSAANAEATAKKEVLDLEKKISDEKKKQEEEARKQAEKQQEEAKKQAENIKKAMEDQKRKLSDQTRIRLGQEKDVMREEALRNAEKAKGAKLTQDEINKISALSDMQYDFNNIKTNLTTSGVITNDLASRGGFSSSVRVDSAKDINAQVKNIFNVLNRINSAVTNMTI